MPPPSTPFDDDAGTQRVGSGAGTRDPDSFDEQDPEGQRPNYLVRRAIVVGVVVAIVAAAGILIGTLIGGSDDASSSGAASVDWNRIVLIDQRTGKVTVVDESGEETVAITTDVRTPTDSAVIGSTALLTADASTAVVDLGSESVQPIELGAASIVRPTGSTLTMIAPATTGRRGLLVHGPSGDVIDTDALAPVAGAHFEFADSLTGTSGRDVLVTDSGNFQSVLFSFDRDEPSFFPGLALAVGDDIVVTAQNVGSDATVSVFDHDGEPIASGRTPSVRAAMISGDQIRLVTVDGQIVTMDATSGDTETGDQLDVGTISSGSVMTSGDRLVVTGSTGTAIIDDQGAVVTVVPDAQPGDDGAALRGSTCISLVATPTSGPSELTILDSSNGEAIADAELAGEALQRSADGCIVAIGSETGYDIVDAGGAVSVADEVLVALAPDGLDTVVERDRRLVLTPIDPATDSNDDGDGNSDPVELAPRGRWVAFTDL